MAATSLSAPSRWSASLWLAAATLAAARASDVTFTNKCATPVELFNLADLEPRNATVIASGVEHVKVNLTGYNYFRHSDSAEATLVSLRIDATRGVSYDISIIPPQAMYCTSFETCRDEAHGHRGFNVPVRVVPAPTSPASDRCQPISCGGDDPLLCGDAFLFPADSADKYKLCDADTSFQIEFCPDGSVAPSAPSSTDKSDRGDQGAVIAMDPQGRGSLDGDVVRSNGDSITFGNAGDSPTMAPAVVPTTPATAAAPINFAMISGSDSSHAVGAVAAPHLVDANSTESA